MARGKNRRRKARRGTHLLDKDGTNEAAQHQEENPQQNPKASGTETIATKSNSPKPNRADPERQRQSDKPWYLKKPKPEWALVWVTIVLTVASIFQSYYTRQSVNVAIEAVRSANDQFVRTERPFVFVAIKTVERCQRNINAVLCADVPVENYGKTPAVHVTYWGKIVYPNLGIVDLSRGFGVDEDGFFRLLDSGTTAPNPFNNGVLPPGQKYHLTFPTPGLTEAQVNTIFGSDGNAFVVGRIDYQDVSGNRYRSDFCVELLKTRAALQCQNHNDVR